MRILEQDGAPVPSWQGTVWTGLEPRPAISILPRLNSQFAVSLHGFRTYHTSSQLTQDAAAV